MAWDPSSDIPLRGSHAPRVGAGESRAKAATRRVESASATAAADGDGSDLLDRVGETLEELAEFLAGGAVSLVKTSSDSLRSAEICQSVHRPKTPSLVGGRRPASLGRRPCTVKPEWRWRTGSRRAGRLSWDL